MITQFQVSDKSFQAELEQKDNFLRIQSSPRPYTIEIESSGEASQKVLELIKKAKHPIVVIDRKVMNLNFAEGKAFDQMPYLAIDALEDNKNIQTVLDQVLPFLLKNNATRSSMIFVIGGGILQDLGAFACAMLKRGVPWTFVPTTLLAQCDSCAGGKAALNHNKTKNLLGLFSAPRAVYNHTGFLNTLSDADYFSGAGEFFRLLVTGGETSVRFLEDHIDGFVRRNPTDIAKLLFASLSVKRQIIEFDEFETDIRRVMNYGHSIGHALEAQVHYAIPHGTAVAIGMLVENLISEKLTGLSSNFSDRILKLGQKIVPNKSFEYLAQSSLKGILAPLSNDKKAEGTVLKLALPIQMGHIRFIDFPLNAESELMIIDIFNRISK